MGDATTAGRRSAALLAHYLANDLEGMTVVFDELKTSEDTSLLILGLLGMFEHLLGQFPPSAIAHIRDAAVRLSAREGEQ